MGPRRDARPVHADVPCPPPSAAARFPREEAAGGRALREEEEPRARGCLEAGAGTATGGRCAGLFGTEAGARRGGGAAQRAPRTERSTALPSGRSFLCVSGTQVSERTARLRARGGESAPRVAVGGACLTDGGVASHLEGQAAEGKTLRGCPSAGCPLFTSQAGRGGEGLSGWSRGHRRRRLRRVGTRVIGHSAGTAVQRVERVLEMGPRRGFRMNGDPRCGCCLLPA